MDIKGFEGRYEIYEDSSIWTVGNRFNGYMLKKYFPILQELRIMDEANNVDINKVKLFLDSAFNKQPILTVPILSIPFKFDESGGKALVDILNRYREQDMEQINKSWFEVEIDETIILLRKKLEEMNNIDSEHLDGNDICDIKNIYKTLYYIKCIKKEMSMTR